VFRRWRAAKKAQKLCQYAERYGHAEPEELQRLRDQQSPLRAKYGYLPK
jgi:hypothetical protein